MRMIEAIRHRQAVTGPYRAEIDLRMQTHEL